MFEDGIMSEIELWLGRPPRDESALDAAVRSDNDEAQLAVLQTALGHMRDGTFVKVASMCVWCLFLENDVAYEKNRLVLVQQSK